MKISIASYAFHGLKGAGMMDVFGYLETCKYRYQLDAADFWNGLLGPDELIFQAAFTDKVKAALAERDMVLANYHVDGVHVWEDDAAKRDDHHRRALLHLEVARKLGAQTVRIDAGGQGHAWTQQQWDLLIPRFQEYAKIGAEFGCKVGPESHWGPELVPNNMEKLAREVNHPGFGILLHLGHWEQAPEEEGDRRLARWAAHTHVDARVTSTRLEAAMKILQDAGYQGYWGVEHHTGKNEYSEVAWQLAEVRRVLQRQRIAATGAPA